MRALLFTALFFCVLEGVLRPALAQVEEKSLSYKASPSDVREAEVIDFLAKTENLAKMDGYGLSAVDLNGDGAMEWVVREDKGQNCTASAACRFFIVALKHKKPTVLAKIYAGNITLRNQKIYGVRSLGVYNDPKDDFHAIPYHWKPELRTFSPN